MLQIKTETSYKFLRSDLHAQCHAMRRKEHIKRSPNVTGSMYIIELIEMTFQQRHTTVCTNSNHLCRNTFKYSYKFIHSLNFVVWRSWSYKGRKIIEKPLLPFQQIVLNTRVSLALLLLRTIYILKWNSIDYEIGFFIYRHERESLNPFVSICK